MGYSRSSAAIEQIGYLFGSTNDFYLRMFILHKKDFRERVQTLQRSISKTPPSAGAYETCERTNRILKAHDYGMRFLTINRARLLLDGDKVMIDWKYVRPTSLSVEDMNKWAVAGGHLASNIRSADS